ncbi:unnamed protein product [Schistosoma haematobium]|nr:unnamed protein product [Schistosoma haematobium]CAH8661995.1 unnamed protein product [Schistosoma haematobium]
MNRKGGGYCYQGKERFITVSFCIHRSSFKRLIAIASANFKRLEFDCLLITLKDFSISTSCPVSRRCLVMAPIFVLALFKIMKGTMCMKIDFIGTLGFYIFISPYDLDR